VTYRVELDLTGGAAQFDSVTTVEFGCRQVGASSFIDLIAPEVTSVELNGQALEVDKVFQDCRITLPALAAQNRLVVKARPAYSHSGEGLHRFVDPVDQEIYLYTQFEPADARRVFAVFEQPDIKASFSFVVWAPKSWTVLSNQPARLVEPTAGGQNQIHHFEPTAKLSSYLTAICAGPLAAWHDQVTSTDGRTIPLGLYARASLAQHVDAANIFATTKQGFGFFEPTFDFPFPFSKYDQVFCPEYNFGAMENAGLVTITEGYVFRSVPVQARLERRAITILHELSHMWFGDLVTMRWWDDLWLNESFAEFVSHLAAVAVTEWRQAWTTFAYSEKLWAYRQDQLPTTHPVLAPIEDLDDVQNNFDGITYAKGASVLRQLVAWVGQDAFIEALRSYFSKHAWSNTTLADLLAELALASGRDLGQWSEKWLKTAGVNTMTGQLTGQTLSIRQSAPKEHPTLRPHRMGLGGFGLAGGQLTRIWNREIDVPPDGVSLLLDGEAGDLVLLNDRDLTYSKIRLDPASFEVALLHVWQVDDSLARAVIWGALFDAVRDGEYPASGYVRAVLRSIGNESHATARQILLRQLDTCLRWYVDPARRLDQLRHATQRLASLAEAAGPGSDSQLLLIKTLARQAQDPAALDLVEALLNGQRSLPGLSIDTDLRWELLMPLIAAGRQGEVAIDAQLAADPTATGREQAAALRAALPNSEAKTAAWLRAVEDPATANATQRQLIDGFGRVVDRSLLRPFAQTYFDSVERVWDARSGEMAANVAEGLYPAWLLNDPEVDVLALTSDFLAALGDRKPPLRRLVVEGMSGVQRALAAQACDAARGASLAGRLGDVV